MNLSKLADSALTTCIYVYRVVNVKGFYLLLNHWYLIHYCYLLKMQSEKKNLSQSTHQEDWMNEILGPSH